MKFLTLTAVSDKRFLAVDPDAVRVIEGIPDFTKQDAESGEDAPFSATLVTMRDGQTYTVEGEPQNILKQLESI